MGAIRGIHVSPGIYTKNTFDSFKYSTRNNRKGTRPVYENGNGGGGGSDTGDTKVIAQGLAISSIEMNVTIGRLDIFTPRESSDMVEPFGIAFSGTIGKSGSGTPKNCITIYPKGDIIPSGSILKLRLYQTNGNAKTLPISFYYNSLDTEVISNMWGPSNKSLDSDTQKNDFEFEFVFTEEIESLFIGFPDKSSNQRIMEYTITKP